MFLPVRRKMRHMSEYDPFIRGAFTVQSRTTEARDTSRHRVFKCEIWNPSAAGVYPLIVYSHFSGGNRRAASFLCEHMCSHGYVVAAVDHSETFVPELALTPYLSREERAVRAEGWIASRVPDVRFVIDHMLKYLKFN